MKERLRFVFSLILGLSLMATVSAQLADLTWADAVLEDKGDTLVIKSSDMLYQEGIEGVNVIFVAIMGDTTATGERNNPNRVYETVRGGYYYYDTPATIDATVPVLHIVAPDGTDLPPLHLKLNEPDGHFDKAYFRMNGSVEFYMENQYICQSVADNARDRNFFRSISPDSHFWFENCIFELSNWAFLSNFSTGCTFKLTNSLCMNVGREANLEKGNILDGNSMDTVWFENNTFLNFGNLVICRPDPGHGPRFAYFNHNTLVNAQNNPFYFFSQAEMVATNNLFINQGFVPDYPDFYTFYQDNDKLPKGIINIDTVEDSWITDNFLGDYPYDNDGDRKVLVDKNDAWWDSRFQDMFDNDLAAFPDTIDEVWASQMMTMNTRAQAMFDDDTNYPYLVEGTWYNVEPDFAVNEDIVDEWVQFIITNAIPGAPNGGNAQPNWRTNLDVNLSAVDWPILPDLSYTTAELVTGGVNSYPLGDLNWFPELKASWETTGEPAKLIEAMMAGQLPEDWAGVRVEERFETFNGQVAVYPNPVQDMATVKFNIVQSTNVELIVYNVLGERVQIHELGQYDAGEHEVTFNKGTLSSGMYILQLNTNYNKAGLTTKMSVK